MGGAKGSSGTRNYHGTCAGIVCLGQLDFIWGLMVNNALAWPAKVHSWDSKLYQQGAHVIWTDGNVYKALANTWNEPPADPWTLFAIPYAAGTWAAGSVVLYDGNVWSTTAGSSLAPPASLPAGWSSGTLYGTRYSANGWTYISTPHAWAGPGSWAANSIVAWEGRVYTNSAETSNQPPGAPWSLWKVDRASSPNPLKMTVPGSGDVYLYWGTPDQVLDVGGEATLNALGHPPYRNRAVLVLKNFLFGPETTTPPDVTVLGGRVPVQALIDGASADMDADWQVNPWCILAELMTHPIFGLGLPIAMFDAASWQAEADRCAANPQLYYVSPLYTQQLKVRDAAADILAYVDGFIRWNSQGKIAAGHWPHGEAPPAFDATNTINRDNLVEEPSWDSEGWGGTVNNLELSFRDVQAAFKSRPVVVPNLWNRAITQRVLSQKVDRPHIVRINQATAWAAESAKILGQTSMSGELTIRAETASAVQPGSLFLLTDDVLGVSKVQRCTRKTIAAQPQGTVKIAHETERGIAPQPYSPTPAAPPANPGVKPSPLLNFQVCQLPFDLSGLPHSIACLAARGDSYENGFDLYMRSADPDSYQMLGRQPAFAVAGQIVAGYGGPWWINDTVQGTTYQAPDTRIYGTWTVAYWVPGTTPGDPLTQLDGHLATDYVFDTKSGQLTVLPGGGITDGSSVYVEYTLGYYFTPADGTLADDLEALGSSLSQDQVDDNTVLVFAFNPDSPYPYEIMSMKSLTALEGGNYQVSVYGQRYNTLMGTTGVDLFGQGCSLFIIPRASLVAMAHASLEALFLEEETAHFLLAPSNNWEDSDLTDLYDAASNPTGSVTQADLAFVNANSPRPSWDFIGEDTGGGVFAAISDFSTVFSTGQKFRVQFSFADPNAETVTATLVAALGQNEVVLWSSVVPIGPSSRTVDFYLPGSGQWEIALVLLDRSGNRSRTVLNDGSGEVWLNVSDVSTAPTPVVLSYQIAGPPGPSQTVYNLKFGPLPTAVTVKWQLQSLGTPYDDGAWSDATNNGDGTFSIPTFLSERTLYAKCTESGDSDSRVISWNYAAMTSA